MPSFSTSEEWLRQSALLIQACPTTTRITTKYHIPNLESAKHQKRQQKAAVRAAKYAATASSKQQSSETTQSSDPATTTTTTTTIAAERQARAYLELKTYDPTSGTCLKYKTDKAAEVGRLIGSLGRLGARMAALPEKPETAQDMDMKDAEANGTTAQAAAAAAEPGAPIGDAAAAQQAKAQQVGGGGAGGAKNKKKKGKR